MAKNSKALGILLYLLLTVFSFKSLAQYQLMPSKDPIIDGLTTELRKKSVNLRELDKIVRELSQDGLYQIVFVETLPGNQVVIRAQKSTKIRNIQIRGQSSFSQNQLLEILEIKKGDNLSDLEIRQAIEKISKAYRDDGFYNFNIGYNRVTRKDGVELIITIDEKSSCTIENIKIFSKNEGLNKFLQNEIREYQKAQYHQDTSQFIQKKINDFLLQNRYLAARVSNTGTIFNKSKTKVKLSFTVDNPIQFEFIFHGNKFFSHFNLAKNAEIGEKFLYLSDSSNEIIESVRNQYLQAGFPEIEIQFTEKFYPDQKKKVMIFNIQEEQRVR
ncbi:MAG: POTRA domain-containing protein, partial [Pseudomonadota bacterium]